MLSPYPELPLWVWLFFEAFEFVTRIITLDIVPKYRRASTSTARLLLIFLRSLPSVPLYVTFGSWWVMSRRLDDDPEARQLVDTIVAGSTAPSPENYEVPDWPDGLPAGSGNDTTSTIRLSKIFSSFPTSVGQVGCLYNDTAEALQAVAAGIDAMTRHINAPYYQTSWDEYTVPFYEALERAVARGIAVRPLVDHHGMHTTPDHKDSRRRLNVMGIKWHEMLPFALLRGWIRHPDLRSHRRILIIGERETYVGSHNLATPDYDTSPYAGSGMLYDDTSVSAAGPIVTQVQAILAVDWYYACRETLTSEILAPLTV